MRRILLYAMLILGLTGAARADMDAGIEAYKRGDYGGARQAWAPLASAGNPAAQYFLGHLYAKGQGVAQDHDAALTWFRAAATGGDAYGQFALGYLYEHGQGVGSDLNAAARWYRAAAEQGNLAARNNLGLMYEQGRGVARDYVRAYAWYARAAAGPGLEPDRAAGNQARLAARMTPAERAAARRLLAEWGY
ncbi:MAG: tetratricopeptide repeat protein [Kiloniellales bacterium]